MGEIRNDTIAVELDDRWPRVRKLTRLDSAAWLGGCDPSVPFALEINGARYEQAALDCRVAASGQACDYHVAVGGLGLTLRFRFALEGEQLVYTLAEVTEAGDFRLEKLYVPDHRLVTGTAAGGDGYLRSMTRRRNWSSEWCPGTATYDHWEDTGAVAGGCCERGAQYTNHACVWNDGMCAAVACSIRVEPLMTALSAEGSIQSGRAGRFSIWAGTYSYRLRGHRAEPLEVRIALLGDADGNGRIDWVEAANWEGDRFLPSEPEMYKEVLVYKLNIAVEGEPFARKTFADCLTVIRDVHDASGGMPQVCYVVGWQYDGHDTGYPSLAVVNPKCGGREGLAKLIDRAKGYNCTVSLHINYDSCYSIHPEWREDCVSRDGEHRPFVWYTKPYRNNRKVYSMNHTKDVESGFARDRLDRLCEMLPIEKTIHLDAFRPYGEAWEPDGSHIDAECEVQRGIVPIIAMFREKGIDITTEDTDDEKRGLFRWVWIRANWTHGYKTVMTHGRLYGRGRSGLRGGKGSVAAEGAALGLGHVASEGESDYKAIVENIYLHWMYDQLLSRKRMTGYRIGDWNLGVQAWYADDTYVHGEPYPYLVEARYEGIPIARGTDRFLPWRPDVIFAFSVDGGCQEWLLPESWQGAAIRADLCRRGGTVAHPDLEVEGRTIRFTAPAGMPVKFTKT